MTKVKVENWQERAAIWLGLLCQAMEENDVPKGRQAQRSLRRLGIEIRFRLPLRARREVNDARNQ